MAETFDNFNAKQNLNEKQCLLPKTVLKTSPGSWNINPNSNGLPMWIPPPAPPFHPSLSYFVTDLIAPWLLVWIFFLVHYSLDFHLDTTIVSYFFFISFFLVLFLSFEIRFLCLGEKKSFWKPGLSIDSQKPKLFNDCLLHSWGTSLTLRGKCSSVSQNLDSWRGVCQVRFINSFSTLHSLEEMSLCCSLVFSNILKLEV